MNKLVVDPLETQFTKTSLEGVQHILLCDRPSVL